MLTSFESKRNEDEKYRQWNDFDYGRDHGKDREMVEAEKDKKKAETGKKNSENGEKDEENSGKDEEDEENSEKSEKDEENSEKDEKDSLLRLHERVRVQAEEFWRTTDDESNDEKKAEKEAEKEVQEEKEAEKEEFKGTPTSTGVVIITPCGRTKEADARKVNTTPPEIVVIEIVELAEKEAKVEVIHTEQEVIQTEIVEKEAEVTEKDVEVAEKEDQDVDEEEEKAEERSFSSSSSTS
ncbi:unnamed protein product [Brassica rapa subsp. narinosa]